jgi:hypothetical protein
VTWNGLANNERTKVLTRPADRVQWTVPDVPDVVPCPDSNFPASSPPAPLKPHKRWPDACRPDLACEIGAYVYPAPDSLTSREALWWVDFLQLRVAAARTAVNNVLAAAVGAIFGLAVAASSFAFTTRSSVTAAVVVVTVLLVAGLTWFLLHDSDHQALEQRWMLYRHRARETGETL